MSARASSSTSLSLPISLLHQDALEWKDRLAAIEQRRGAFGRNEKAVFIISSRLVNRLLLVCLFGEDGAPGRADIFLDDGANRTSSKKEKNKNQNGRSRKQEKMR
eukprot:scaffold10861_cov180-Amphora_coffeaeformis.AAC.51